MKTRRQFLSICTAVTAGISVAPSVALGLPLPSQTAISDPLSYLHFVSQLHTRFEVIDGSGGAQEMVLYDATVNARKNPALEARMPFECFSLMFRGNPERSLGQDTYTFRHEILGNFSMFIVPMGLSKGQYQAVFSLPKRGMSIQLA
jgi:hypothetical protein